MSRTFTEGECLGIHKTFPMSYDFRGNDTRVFEISFTLTLCNKTLEAPQYNRLRTCMEKYDNAVQ